MKPVILACGNLVHYVMTAQQKCGAHCPVVALNMRLHVDPPKSAKRPSTPWIAALPKTGTRCLWLRVIAAAFGRGSPPGRKSLSRVLTTAFPSP